MALDFYTRVMGVWVLRNAATAAAIALGVALLLPAIANYLAMYAGPGARTLLDRCTHCRVVRSP